MFKSRWQALFWSASILLTAYCSVPSKDQSDGATDFAKSVASKYAAQHQSDHHTNPWAKDPD